MVSMLDPVETMRTVPWEALTGCGVFEGWNKTSVDLAIGCDDTARREHVVGPVQVACHAAGFTHQDDAGGHVPSFEVAFPKGVETPCCNPGKIDCCRAGAADAGGVLHHDPELFAEYFVLWATAVGNAGGADTPGERAAAGDTQAASVVLKRALPLLGGVALVKDRIVNDACN